MCKRFVRVVSVVLLIAVFWSNSCVMSSATPVALTPAVKYAVGAALAGGGLYMADMQGLDYVVQDYWDTLSSQSKAQWHQIVTYGTTIGSIAIGSMYESINEYLAQRVTGTEGYFSGSGEITYGDEIIGIKGLNITEINGYRLTDVSVSGGILRVEVTNKESGDRHTNIANCTRNVVAAGLMIGTFYGGTRTGIDVWVLLDNGSYIILTPGPAILLDAPYIAIGGFQHGYEAEQELGLSPGDRVSAPPIPQVDWPDLPGQLEDYFNREGNPDLDRDNVTDDYDWYVDEDGNIYRVPKGQPPRNPGDKKLITGVPLPIPDNYPTIDNPDETITEYPPTSETVTNPDGSTTETITQTRDITRTWYNPDTGRWHTEKTTETTTTTIQRDSTGTEIGRDVVTVPSPGPTTSQPGMPDDTYINWEPLRQGVGSITRKFPFSLPWDFYYSFKQFESGDEWDGKYHVQIESVIADWDFWIDFTMFDGIRNIVKKIELILFDVGLILATRRLMGGGV